MYAVIMGHECACFKKSEYENSKQFDNQKDAYNYANVLAELMNEDFCSTHLFSPQMTTENDFIIAVTDNPDSACGSGSCSTTEADTGCDTGSCGCS